jgi:hypothetical protein
MPRQSNRKPKPDLSEIRAVLFADLPLEEWKPRDGVSDSEPWASFERARICLAGGDAHRDVGGAVDALTPVTENADLESRQILQAWSCLRNLGVNPLPRDAKHVHGVVLEVPVDGGLDLLAAYADHSARYLNHAGNVLIWDTREPAMDGLIDDLLHACQRIADAIGPWEGERPAPPQGDHVRINILTPSGLHFGEATFAVFSEDAMAAPALTAGTTLLQALVERAG